MKKKNDVRNMARPIGVCLECGALFPKARENHTFCCDQCRVKNWRWKQKAKERTISHLSALHKGKLVAISQKYPIFAEKLERILKQYGIDAAARSIDLCFDIFRGEAPLLARGEGEIEFIIAYRSSEREE